MMIGYTAFRTMSSAKHIKDDYEREAVEISLQVFGIYVYCFHFETKVT